MPSVQLKFALSLLLFFTFSSIATAQDLARAAWEVTHFDVTANVGPANEIERWMTARIIIAARNVGKALGSTFTVRVNPKAEIKTATVNDASAKFTTRTDPQTKLLQATINVPTPVAPGGQINVAIEYRLPVAENSGLVAISPEGSQFLPLSYWYPSPNTQFAPRGADTAPVRLTVNTAGGETVISSGQSSGQTFEQTLNAQPFFLTGKWDQVEGAGDARGVSAWLFPGASAEERKRGEELIALAHAARNFYAELMGPITDVPIRLVSVRRGAGFDMAGTVLLDGSVFRRSKIDSVTALLVAESMAHLWIGGATGVQGEGAGAVREGLGRYLATLFLEKQYGREVAEAERMRMALLYTPIAKRDAPLSISTPALDTHFTSVTNKGALVWRLVSERAVGREQFLAMLKREFQPGRNVKVSLASLRASLGERGNEKLQRIFNGLFDQPTDTDLMIGAPQQKGGEWVAALRNVGSLDADVTAIATTESGERVAANVTIPARDFSEAKFKTASKITRVEVDPEKFYLQLDFSNDIFPRTQSPDEAVAEATRLFTQQKYKEAADLAREVIGRASPQMQDARVILGRALIELNNLGEAEKEFRAALDTKLPTPATLAWANIGLGEIALRKNQLAEAARLFNEAVRTDADYASAIAARAGRVKAEKTPTVDDSVKAFIAQLDQAIQSGRKANLDTVILPGELTSFVRGIVGNQPEVWQTRVLRTEAFGSNRLIADVAITTKALSREQSGTAVFVLSRVGDGWRLSDIQFFEVR